MGKKPSAISDFVKGQIVVLIKDENSQVQIAKHLKISGVHLNPKYTLETVKHQPSLMVSGAITAARPCGLVNFGKGVKINSVKYIEVQEANVKMHK